MPVETIKWVGNVQGYAEIIDQTLLPTKFCLLKVRDVETMRQAIKTLQVRGAPALGIAAAYGVVLGLQKIGDGAPITEALAKLKQICDCLASSRPTAANLFWALERMWDVATSNAQVTTRQFKERLLAEAQAIRDEDAAMCRAIGAHGCDLIPEGGGVLTHCNAGGLATADYGTALAVMFTAHERGRRFGVYVDETRPLLQGARLTTWELMQAGIDVTLICDNAAGHLMDQGKINLVITGADRIAANGDAANKIGTYTLAVLAHVHEIPFYMAAPSSTFDLTTPNGTAIPIEQRQPEEVTNPWGNRIAPADVKVYNPAFDVTPNHYITAIITERGVIQHPETDSVKSFFAGEQHTRSVR